MRDVRKGDVFIFQRDVYVILCDPFQDGLLRVVLVSMTGCQDGLNVHKNAGVTVEYWNDCELAE